MAEKNILAYFQTEHEAENAAQKLQSLRMIDISIDRIHAGGGGGEETTPHPLNGQMRGLGQLVLGEDATSRTEAILAAAGPDASGMASGEDPAGTRRVLLTCVTPSSEFEKALQVIRDAGGFV